MATSDTSHAEFDSSVEVGDSPTGRVLSVTQKCLLACLGFLCFACSMRAGGGHTQYSNRQEQQVG